MDHCQANHQQEMADTEFSAAVGGGAVQVTVTGKGEMRGVKIDPSAVDADNWQAGFGHWGCTILPFYQRLP